MTTVRLSCRAEQDIKEIRTFTLERWGEEQWFRYFVGLSAAMDRIAVDPNCGRPRDVLLNGMRSLPHERHIFFFLPTRSGISRAAILRLVHQRRNLGALAYYDDLGR